MISVKNKDIALILGSAFLLRLAGIAYGLPNAYHQDEPMMVHHALAIGTGDWNTHYFVIPPFVNYFLFLIYAAFYALGRACGAFSGAEAFALYFLKDPSWFYLLARFFVAVVPGTATVWLVYMTGQRFFSRRTGVWSALFLAVLPLHVQHSHYAYADAAATFAILVLLYRLLKLQEDPSLRNYLIVGLALGWGAAIKYTPVYAVPVIVGAHLYLHRQRPFAWAGLQKLFAAGAVSLAFFALLAPYTFLDWPHFLATMHRQSAGESFVGWTHHLLYSLVGGTSWPFMALAFWGMALLGRRSYAGGVLLCFAGLFYSINSVFTQHYARYMLPLAPVLALFAAEGWVRLGEYLRSGRVRALASAAMIAQLCLPALYLDMLFMKDDTRRLAAQWIESRTRGGETLIVDSRFFAPSLTRQIEPGQLGESLKEGSGLDALRRKRLELLEKSENPRKKYRTFLLVPDETAANREFLFSGPFLEADAEKVRRSGARYVVFNHAEKIEALHRLKEGMAGELKLEAVFSPYRRAERRTPLDMHATTGAPHLPAELLGRERLGPYLEIYSLESA